MKVQLIRALMIGNALEYYDFFLYTFFVSVLSPLYFPATDPLAALMMGYGVFAVGFFSRPIGALVFGHWGDIYGRKKALMSTLILMAISTVGIGLLPTYETLGLAAPLLLILFRIAQGFAAGGEVNGAAVFGLESTEQKRHGLAGSLINSSAGIGAILATTMGALFTNDFMPEWAWRIPFCMGGLVAFVGLYVRWALHEEAMEKRVTIPLLDVIKNHQVSFIKALGVGSFIHVPFYIIVGYMNPTLHSKGIISSFELMTMNTIVTLMGVIVIPLFGHWSDKVGQRKLMFWGAIGQFCLAIPVFMIYSLEEFTAIVLSQVGLLMLCEAYIAPSNAYLNSLFPKECRYTGVAFGSCLGTALFGGTTPLICSYLAMKVSPVWGPSLYLMSMASLGMLALFWKRKTFKIVQANPEFI
jgi:MHS family proline/betaine transporter-like MFS transporter